MDQKSQSKVIEAGFSIIRCDDQPSPRIKIKDKHSHEWRTLTKHPTKAERDRIFNDLLENDKFLSD